MKNFLSVLFARLRGASLSSDPDPFLAELRLSERSLPDRLNARETLDTRALRVLDRAKHRPISSLNLGWKPKIVFDQIGWLMMARGHHAEPLLAGVVAIRARILSFEPIEQVELFVDDEVVVTNVVPQAVHTDGSFRHVSAVNIWIDAARFGAKRAALKLVVKGKYLPRLKAVRWVNFSPAQPARGVEASPSFVPSVPADVGDITGSVVARPVRIDKAKRNIFDGEVQTILVMRLDQLGDLSATLPALRRLREFLPQARITALVAPAYRSLVEASDLCDEVLDLTLRYNLESERRYVEAEELKRFAESIAERQWDVAMDLCPSTETRDLLLAIDARFLVGFNPGLNPFLDFGIDVISRDKINRLATLSHAALLMSLVEAFGVAMRLDQGVVARARNDNGLLQRFDLTAAGYIVVHTGARHEINRWPMAHFIDLACRIAEATRFRVVLFVEEQIDAAAARLLQAAGVMVFSEKISVDEFDALLSSSRMMIGNDTGPKHLAAVRGVETVSIHIARLNWNEWGQDGRGIIISKRVPCAGCGINDIKICAKDAICVTSITVDDVWQAIQPKLLGASTAA